MNIAQYSKSIIALAGALTIIGTSVGDGIVSQTEYTAIATSVIALIGVFLKRNTVREGDDQKAGILP